MILNTQRKSLPLRLATGFLLSVGTLFLPWWFMLLCIVPLFFVFDYYFELCLLAFLMDVLYGSPLPHFGRFEFVFSIGSLLIYLILTVIKKRIRV